MTDAHSQIRRFLFTFSDLGRQQLGHRSMILIIIAFWLLALPLPLTSIINGFGAVVHGSSSIVPFQYITSVIATITVTFLTYTYARYIMKSYGVQFSELSETLNFCQRIMTTALISFIIKLLIYVSCYELFYLSFIVGTGYLLSMLFWG